MKELLSNNLLVYFIFLNLIHSSSSYSCEYLHIICDIYVVKGKNGINNFIFGLFNFEKVPNQLVGAPLGTDVQIECHVEASPKSINYWIKDTGM